MDLILTSRTYSFDNSSLHEISLSDHRLIYKILKKCIIKISKAEFGYFIAETIKAATRGVL